MFTLEGAVMKNLTSCRNLRDVAATYYWELKGSLVNAAHAELLPSDLMLGGMKQKSVKIGEHTLVVNVMKSDTPEAPMSKHFERVTTNRVEYVFLTGKHKPDCGTLLVDRQHRIGYIALVSNGRDCLRFVDGDTIMDHVGTIMVQMMIEWCRLRGVKQVYLDDISFLSCKLPHMVATSKINLAVLHTMTSGTPWYQTFGFRFVDEADERLMSDNQALHSKLRTHMVDKSDLGKMFKDAIRRYNTQGADMHRAKYVELMQLYDKHANDLFGVFLRKMHKRQCDVFANCYDDLYADLGYHRYRSRYMVLQL